MSHGRAELVFLVIKLVLALSQRLVPHLGVGAVWPRPVLALGLVYSLLYFMPHHSYGANVLRGGFFFVFFWTSVVELARSIGLSESMAGAFLLLGLPVSFWFGTKMLRKRWMRTVKRVPSLDALIRMISREDEPGVSEQFRRRLRLRTQADVEITVRHIMAGCDTARATGYNAKSDDDDEGGHQDQFEWLLVLLGFSQNGEDTEQSNADRNFDARLMGGSESPAVAGMSTRGRKIAAAQYVYHRAALETSEMSSLFFLSYLNWVHITGESVQISISAAEAAKISTIDLRFAFFRYLFERRRSAVGEGVGTVKYLDLSKSKQTANRYQKIALRELRQLWVLLSPGRVDLERVRSLLHKIGQAERHASRAFASLVSSHSYSASVLRQYGIFLAKVHNDQAGAERFLELADIVEEEAAASRAASLAHRLNRSGQIQRAPGSPPAQGNTPITVNPPPSSSSSLPYTTPVARLHSAAPTKIDEDEDDDDVEAGGTRMDDGDVDSNDVIGSSASSDGGDVAPVRTRAQLRDPRGKVEDDEEEDDIANILGVSEEQDAAATPPKQSSSQNTPNHVPIRAKTTKPTNNVHPGAAPPMIDTTNALKDMGDKSSLLGSDNDDDDDDDRNATQVTDMEQITDMGRSTAWRRVNTFTFGRTPGAAGAETDPKRDLQTTASASSARAEEHGVVLDTETTTPREFPGIRQFRMTLVLLACTILVVLTIPLVINIVAIQSLLDGVRLSVTAWRREYVALALATRLADEERYLECGSIIPDAAGSALQTYTAEDLVSYDEILGELIFVNHMTVFCGVGAPSLSSYSKYLDSSKLECANGGVDASPTRGVVGEDGDIKYVETDEGSGWVVFTSERTVDDLVQRLIVQGKNYRSIRDPDVSGVPIPVTQSFWAGLGALIRFQIDYGGGARRMKEVAEELQNGRRELTVHQPGLLFVPNMPICMANYTVLGLALTQELSAAQQRILYNIRPYTDAIRDGAREVDSQVADTGFVILAALVGIAIALLAVFIAMPFFLLRGVRAAFFEAQVGLYLLDSVPTPVIAAYLRRADGVEQEEAVTEATDMAQGTTFDGNHDLEKGEATTTSPGMTSKGSFRAKTNAVAFFSKMSSHKSSRGFAGAVPASLCLEMNRVRPGSVVEEAIMSVRRRVAAAAAAANIGDDGSDGRPGSVVQTRRRMSAGSTTQLHFDDDLSKRECLAITESCCRPLPNARDRLNPASSKFDPVRAIGFELYRRSTREPRFAAAQRFILIVNAILIVVVLSLIITLPVIFSESQGLQRQLSVIEEYLSTIARTSWEVSIRRSKESDIYTWANLPYNVSISEKPDGSSLPTWFDFPTSYDSTERVNDMAEDLEFLHRCSLYGCSERNVAGVSTSEDIADYFFGGGDRPIGVDAAVQQFIEQVRGGGITAPLYQKFAWSLLAELPRLYTAEIESWSNRYFAVMATGVSLAAFAGLVVSAITYKRYVLHLEEEVRNTRFILSLFPDRVIDRIPFARSFVTTSSWVECKRDDLEDIGRQNDEDDLGV